MLAEEDEWDHTRSREALEELSGALQLKVGLAGLAVYSGSAAVYALAKAGAPPWYAYGLMAASTACYFVLTRYAERAVEARFARHPAFAGLLLHRRGQVFGPGPVLFGRQPLALITNRVKSAAMGLLVFLDMPLDANSAGMAEKILATREEEHFKHAWQHVPLIGGYLHEHGLAGSMEAAFMAITAVQFCFFLGSCVDPLLSRSGLSRRSLAFLADACGLDGVAELVADMGRAEGADVRHGAISRQMKELLHHFLEGIVAVVLALCLFSYSLDGLVQKGRWDKVGLLALSVGTSARSLAAGTASSIAAVFYRVERLLVVIYGLYRRGMRDLVGPIAKLIGQMLVAQLFFCVSLWAALRFGGIWLCPSHVVNVLAFQCVVFDD